MPLAPTGHAHLGSRVHQPHHGQRAQAAFGRERAVRDDRVALDRDQEIHGNRGHLELAQRKGHLHRVGAALAHSQDQAATGLETVAPGRRERGEAVLVVVRAADFLVARFARVEVVVQAVETRLGEDPGALLVEDPHREADLHRVALLELADQPRELARARERGAAAGQRHAVAARAGAGGLLRLGEDLLVALHRVLADGRLRVARLGAVAAVFGALPALHVVEHVHHHLASEVALAGQVGGVKKRQQLVALAVQDAAGLLLAGGLVAQRALGKQGVGLEHRLLPCLDRSGPGREARRAPVGLSTCVHRGG